MDRLRVNYSNLARLDVTRVGTRISAPPPNPVGSIQRSMISTAIGAASHLSSFASVLNEVVEIAETTKRVGVALVGGRGPMITGPASTSLITVGVGASASYFASFGVTLGGGIYGSNKPELGLYRTMGAGLWTNAGVSGEIQINYTFGGPSTFGGVSWGVGMSADTGVGPSISAMVLFGSSGPPFPLIGFCIGVGAGVSALPVDVTFQVSSTMLVPIGP